MTKDEIIEELVEGYLKRKSIRKHNVCLNCIEVKNCTEDNVDDKQQIYDDIYIFRNIVFDDEDKEPVKMILQSEYYIEIIYAMLGIEKKEYKSDSIDFNSISNTAIVKFSDLQFISQVDNDYNLCIDNYNLNDLCGEYRVSSEISIKCITSTVNVEFDFRHSNNYAKRIFCDETDIYMKCTAFALPKKDKRKEYGISISTWVEVLIHSISSYQDRDYLTATQLAFAALDSCIGDEYNLIHEYLESIDKSRKSKEYVDILNNKIKVFNHPKMDVISKLEHVMKMIDCHDEFENVNKLLEPYRSIRNMLSHGSYKTDGDITRYNYDFENKYRDMLYDFLKVIYLIEYPDYDFEDVIAYN